MRPSTCRNLRLVGVIAVCAATTPLANAAADDACSLLTQPQIAAALGTAVVAGAYPAPAFKKTCTWQPTTNGAGYVTLKLEGLDEYEGGKQVGQMKSVSVTPISGVGDAAYYLAVGNEVGLIVKKGAMAFKVAVYAHIPVEQKQAVERTLAQQVIQKL